MKDPSVIEDALEELDMDQEELETIRQGISFKGLSPRTLLTGSLSMKGSLTAIQAAVFRL